MPKLTSELHLITTFYQSIEEERNKENQFCLEKNLLNPYISKVHLFAEGSGLPDLSNLPEDIKKKIMVVPFGKRPFFKDLFAYANEIKSEAVKVVSNSDIFFDSTLKSLHRCFTKADVLALTRWDLGSDGVIHFYNNYKSQDCWFFKKQIPDTIGHFGIGQPGCDNRLLYELRQNNITYLNPCLSIKAVHVHQSRFRSYVKGQNHNFVEPPFEYALADFCPGSNVSQSPELKKHYALNRYNYYKGYANNTLPGKITSVFNRGMAYFASKYWAFVYNRCNVAYNTSSKVTV